MANVGRPAQFVNAKAKVEALRNLDGISRYHMMQLVEGGLVEVVKVPGEGRGRPRHEYQVSGKGRGLMNLAKNWK